MAGGQHGAGSLPLKRANTQNIDNPLDQRWALRALLVAMNAWVKDGAEPPASVYPRIATGELVRASDVKYPSNVHAPKSPRVPHVLDFGSEPPKEGATYTVLLPQVDRDGNELGVSECLSWMCRSVFTQAGICGPLRSGRPIG